MEIVRRLLGLALQAYASPGLAGKAVHARLLCDDSETALSGLEPSQPHRAVGAGCDADLLSLVLPIQPPDTAVLVIELGMPGARGWRRRRGQERYLRGGLPPVPLRQRPGQP